MKYVQAVRASVGFALIPRQPLVESVTLTMIALLTNVDMMPSALMQRECAARETTIPFTLSPVMDG